MSLLYKRDMFIIHSILLTPEDIILIPYFQLMTQYLLPVKRICHEPVGLSSCEVKVLNHMVMNFICDGMERKMRKPL